MRLSVNHKLGNLAEVVKLDENLAGSKQEKYFQKTRDGKLILREAMRRFVPDEISDGVKQGFSGPDSAWFKGESIEFVREALLNPRNRLYDYMDFKVADRLIQEHLTGQKNRRLLVWSLLYLTEWLDVFTGPASAVAEPATTLGSVA
jgi:asparagine synthase (glutamine-hydrolysing)